MTTRAMHEATCLIMAALAGDSKHSSGIVARVREISRGRVQLRAGTLFMILDQLRTAGLVSIDRGEVAGGSARRYYRLSSAGTGRCLEPAGVAARPDLRVSDADRDAAAAALGEHFAQGRLTADELLARLDLALAAVTRRDIARAGRDLPSHNHAKGGGDDGDLDYSARQDAEAP